MVYSTHRFINRMVEHDVTDDELSLTFAALADPIRRAILVRLSTGEATVNELAEPFSISLQAVSRHLKVLERSGLISRGRDAQFRPCRLEEAPLESAVDWIEEHRQSWEARLGRLDQHLRRIQEQSRKAKATTETQKPKASAATATKRGRAT
jgi:DNA-binding transcriptional ArsR family regulator